MVDPKYLRALVDMGSNGIRFSISNLAPPTARVMPTLFQDRAGISLYDAQYSTGSKGPIPAQVIKDVLFSLLRFKIVCQGFGVPRQNVRIIATEATRTATNSTEFRRAIWQATGWNVDMLAKEEEGRVGAMGVASSFSAVRGLVMDLGGGSTQITWMIVEEGGEVRTNPNGSLSFPYGAAALTRRLGDAKAQGGEAEQQLRHEMVTTFKKAFEDLQVPDDLRKFADENEGFSLYLSGGGFRGWGYLLMSQHAVAPYPIPIINGFQVASEDFQNVSRIQATAAEGEVFRISERRASQVPAVAFLVGCLIEAIPNIKDVRFCQGGVREGVLYGLLSSSELQRDPLETAALPYTQAPDDFGDLLMRALPENRTFFRDSLIRAFSYLLFVHSPLPKETRPAAALHCTTAGILASAHGISHSDRALLALLLCERWGGDVAPTDISLKERLSHLVSPEEAFFTRYLGAVAALVGDVYPAGVVDSPRIQFHARYTTVGKAKHALKLEIGANGDPMTEASVLQGAINAIEKVGKKKHWGSGSGRESFGMKIVVEVEQMQRDEVMG